MRVEWKGRFLRVLVEVSIGSEPGRGGCDLRLCASARLSKDEHARRRRLWKATVREIKHTGPETTSS